MCNSVHALRCYSANQGVGGLGANFTCTSNTAFCYVIHRNIFPEIKLFLFSHLFITKPTKILKATSSIAPTSFPNTVLARSASGLISGDRGCLPDVSVSAAQPTTQQLALEINDSLDGNVLDDYSSVTLLLCLLFVSGWIKLDLA
jgi:hypothetical protein